MEFWIGWFHERSRGEDVGVVAQILEETGFTGVALSDHIAMPKEQASLHPIMKTGFDPLVPYVEPFTTDWGRSRCREKSYDKHRRPA